MFKNETVLRSYIRDLEVSLQLTVKLRTPISYSNYESLTQSMDFILNEGIQTAFGASSLQKVYKEYLDAYLRMCH
jgi:uncharacterized protein Yka (UPF0111/DUF47 family)